MGVYQNCRFIWIKMSNKLVDTSTKFRSISYFVQFSRYAKFQVCRLLWNEDMRESKITHYGSCEDNVADFAGIGD